MIAPFALEMTPRQAIEAIKDEMGLTEEELAGALGTSRRTLQRWRAGTSSPPPLARQRLGELLRLQARVRGTFAGPDAVRRWARAKSQYLHWATPAEAIRAGRLDSAVGTLEVIDSGIFL